MFLPFVKGKPCIQTGIYSDDEGIAVASVQNPGGADPRLYSCDYQPVAVDSIGLKTPTLKGKSKNKQHYLALLNIGEYQLLVVDAPDVSTEELRAALRWRVQELIDIPIEEVVLDVFDAPPGGPAGTLEQLYVVVARKEIIEARVEKLASIGFQLQVIDIPELAMRNIAAQLPEDEYGLVSLYFNNQKCLITLTHNKILYLTRTIDFRFSDVNERKSNHIEFSDLLVLEIQRSLDYYEQHFHKAPIQSIAILPPPVKLDGLDSALNQKLGLNTRTVTLDDIIGSELALETKSAAACVLAVGCALRTEIKAP